MTEKVVGLALVAASVLMTVFLVAPRMIDGFAMGGASVCSVAETENCLEEVEVGVTKKEHGIRKDVGPVRWHLDPRRGDEQILRTPWLGESLDVGAHVALQLWDGDPVAVRNRGDEVHSLAWGVNRWILWAAGALALLLPGLNLLFHSFRPPPDDEQEPFDLTTAVAAQGMLTAVAALFMYPAYSGAGALGATIVIAAWLWFSGALMIRGSIRRDAGSQARGLA